jgi:D-3-phosphoglycerate dehydrogenase
MPGNQPSILVAESSGFSTRASGLLRQVGKLVLADLDRKGLISAARDFDVLWVRLRHQIDAEVLSSAPRLRMIVTPTTGLNHIDLKEAQRRKVHLLSLRGETDFLQDIRATAEHTVALILSLLRHVPQAFAHVQDGGWSRDQFKGHELHEKTVGIVGYGRLGRIVARYLRAFDTKVLATGPNIHADRAEPGITPASLIRTLEESDLITLHVNLCDETKGFFGRNQFAAMKPGAWFINTSRGELVDESALLDALSTGRLAGAAVDVLCEESSAGMGERPLIVYSRKHSNLIITPHIGGCTVESMEKTEIFLAERLVSLLQPDVELNDYSL